MMSTTADGAPPFAATVAPAASLDASERARAILDAIALLQESIETLQNMRTPVVNNDLETAIQNARDQMVAYDALLRATLQGGRWRRYIRGASAK